MVEEGVDIRVHDPNDWQIQVDGVGVLEPLQFEITPEFSNEVELIETLYGEIGFNIMEASSKGTIRFQIADTSDSVNGVGGAVNLNKIAQDRKVVPIFNVNRQNPERYPISRQGLQYCILKPASRTHDRTLQGREYEAIGFGYIEQ